MATPRYTPNGAKIADGYQSSNPYDTGYSGQRNAELNGGQKDTQSGWDYGTGRPISGAVQQSDGSWRMPGSANGGSGAGPGDIPGAAVMAQQVAAGLAEYKKALARLNQNRSGTLTQYGYQGDIDPETGVMKNMRVDSSNPYGVYQGMRRNNAYQYTDLRDARMERGLGAKGLGAQGMDRARNEWGGADTAMAQALTGTLSGFDQQQQGAYQSYQDLLWQMQLEAARAASDGGDYGYDGGDYPWGDPQEEDPTVDPTTGKSSRYPGLPKRMQPVKVNGKWRGSWGPAPSAAQRKIIAGISSVKPTVPRVTKPSTTLNAKKTAAINAAIKKKGGKK